MYPIDVTAERGDGMRSRGLAALGILFPLKILAMVPHLLVLWVLAAVVEIVTWFGYWVVAFTGDLPDFFFVFPERVIAWQVRVYGWLASLTDPYPPFEWEPAGYGVDLATQAAPGPRSRGLAVLGIFLPLKVLALFPHFVVLAFLALAAAVTTWIAYWVILFTGAYPAGMFDFVVGTLRWSTRLNAWLFTLTDEYPPFRLKP
jgi:hypothetical protein